MIVAGVLAICLSVIAHVAVTVVVGWLFVVNAILHLAYSWDASGDGAVLWEVVLAFIFEAAGVYLIANPVVAVGPLTLALAMCLAVEGLLEFVLASQLHPDPGSRWLPTSPWLRGRKRRSHRQALLVTAPAGGARAVHRRDRRLCRRADSASPIVPGCRLRRGG